MTRNDLRETLSALDLSKRQSEQVHRQRMIELLDSCVDCFRRDTFPAHFTGSALVVSCDGVRCLLHHHRKLDRWLQFGGHCDGEEDILCVAQREAFEESGIQGLIVASRRPFDLDIHDIPAIGDEPPHFHYDVRYVLIAPERAEFRTSPESTELRWFSTDEAQRLELDAGLRRMVDKWKSLLARRTHSDL